MSNQAQPQFTPAFVRLENGNDVPDIKTAFGRQQYRTKGQHEQCQPKVQPRELRNRRKEFFTGLFGKDEDGE